MGTVLADFTHIMGDGPVHVPAGPNGAVAFERPFDTGGIRTDQSIVLMFAISNKGGTPADVLVNGTKVGQIHDSPASLFSTQMITIARNSTESKKFNNVGNKFTIMNVADAYDIKSIVCFFHQES